MGSRHGCPHVGRCGIPRRWAARCGQHQESESIVGAQSGPAAKVDFSSLDWCSSSWIGLHSGCCTGSCGQNQDAGTPRTIWGGSSPGRHCGMVFLGYPLSVIRGLVHSLPCSRAAQICRKTVRTWISLRKNRMVDDKKDQRQKPRKWSSGARRVRSGGRRDSGWRNRGRGSVRKSSSSSSSSYSQSRRKRRGRQQNVNEAQKLLEKHDPQHQQWKEEAKKKERAVELQEQTMCALSPSLITPPQFPPSPPGVPSLAPGAEERRGPNDLLGASQLRWMEAELLHKVTFGRNGDTKDEFIQIHGEHSGIAILWRRWVSSSRVMVEEQPFPERKKRVQARCLTLHANNELLCLHLQVFVLVGAWAWYVDSSCFSWGRILGINM